LKNKHGFSNFKGRGWTRQLLAGGRHDAVPAQAKACGYSILVLRKTEGIYTLCQKFFSPPSP
jgi:hypothetical protein